LRNEEAPKQCINTKGESKPSATRSTERKKNRGGNAEKEWKDMLIKGAGLVSLAAEGLHKATPSLDPSHGKGRAGT